jgi:drug/metabolite transporter (DMT)-like permease
MDFIDKLLAGPRPLQWLAIIPAIIAVAVADILLKKTAQNSSLDSALRSPWLWMAVALYLWQIAFFTWALVAGWKLSLIGAMQTTLYALIVLIAGVLIYRENITPLQALGAGLAVVGAVLLCLS